MDELNEIVFDIHKQISGEKEELVLKYQIKPTLYKLIVEDNR